MRPVFYSLLIVSLTLNVGISLMGGTTQANLASLDIVCEPYGRTARQDRDATRLGFVQIVTERLETVTMRVEIRCQLRQEPVSTKSYFRTPSTLAQAYLQVSKI